MTILNPSMTPLGCSNGAPVRAAVVVDGEPEVFYLGIRSRHKFICGHRFMMCVFEYDLLLAKMGVFLILNTPFVWVSA